MNVHTITEKIETINYWPFSRKREHDDFFYDLMIFLQVSFAMCF